MSDAEYTYLDGGIVIDDQGEIIESGGHDDPLSVLAYRRADAYRQKQEWQSYIEALDRVLLRKQQARRTAYGDVVITLASRRYPRTDKDALAATLLDAEASREDLAGLIRAATGFRAEDVPETVRDMFDDFTATLETRPWVTSSFARRAAPTIHKEPMREENDE